DRLGGAVGVAVPLARAVQEDLHRQPVGGQHLEHLGLICRSGTQGGQLLGGEAEGLLVVGRAELAAAGGAEPVLGSGF
ncbi:MAG: hypothetical protein ACK5PF_01765, partial [bacterium]